jgi:hypothetical protein
MPDLNLDSVRRMLDAGNPIPPWIVRGLCDDLELAMVDKAVYRSAIDCVGEYIRLLAVLEDQKRIIAAARAWSDAIDRCDGIAAAEERLLEALKGLS